MFTSTTDPDSPSFAIFLTTGEGLLQLPHPESGSNCLLAFATPYRAADYAWVQLPKLKLELFGSSPAQAAQLIPHFHQHAGINHAALDRCPRCPVFALLDAGALNGPEQIVKAWKISKATELCRLELYWAYARDQANRGELTQAGDVALEIAIRDRCVWRRPCMPREMRRCVEFTPRPTIRFPTGESTWRRWWWSGWTGYRSSSVLSPVI